MELTKANKKFFTSGLLSWHATENNRSLPWKSEKDPYKIWLSEVILQQTRALQGLPYYERFTTTFPTIRALAAAQDEQAFRLWQGLGYYNRCKNMLATARYITNELKGQFPTTYEGLLQLKGIGPYTAAAIASFAYGLPEAVVDGNVYRVLARYFGIETPIDSTTGKKEFATLAGELLDKTDSAAYNQAIMDLGATVCTPKKPGCEQCPLKRKCAAYEQELIDVLPVKSKKTVVKTRFFNYLLLKHKDHIWIHKRTGNDIWANLYEPYLIETDEPLTTQTLLLADEYKKLNIKYTALKYDGALSQRLTHRIINTRFFSINVSKRDNIKINDGEWVCIKDLKNVAFPKTLVSFLENNLYF